MNLLTYVQHFESKSVKICQGMAQKIGNFHICSSISNIRYNIWILKEKSDLTCHVGPVTIEKLIDFVTVTPNYITTVVRGWKLHFRTLYSATKQIWQIRITNAFILKKHTIFIQSSLWADTTNREFGDRISDGKSYH